MKMSSISCMQLSLLFLTFGFKLVNISYCTGIRADDASAPVLETLVQQQASLIQNLQARLNALEDELRGRLAALERNQPEKVTSCPDGWTQFHSSCYGIGHETLPWSEAAEVCERFGGGLAEVETAAEAEFIRQLGNTHGYAGAWLGGTDILLEGQWVWVGSKNPVGKDGSYADWSPGQPDDSHDQDCIFSKQDYGYKWDDGLCSVPFAFICEIKL